MMNRRELLEWVSRGLAAVMSMVIGIPGVRYFLTTVQPENALQSQFLRVMRFKDLVPGRPTIVPITGRKQDAWLQYDQQTIGRVWLIRGTESGETKVTAFSSICPHMGCQVQQQAGGKGFQCPCHRASFGIDGSRLRDPRTGERSPSPRDLDGLECRLVPDEAIGDNWVEVKYEKFKTGMEQRVVGA